MYIVLILVVNKDDFRLGLIVYLTHIGSFVPAESATIGIVGQIYSRIQSTECIAAHMSAFLIDLRQVRCILHTYYKHLKLRHSMMCERDNSQLTKQ